MLTLLICYEGGANHERREGAAGLHQPGIVEHHRVSEEVHHPRAAFGEHTACEQSGLLLFVPGRPGGASDLPIWQVQGLQVRHVVPAMSHHLKACGFASPSTHVC